MSASSAQQHAGPPTKPWLSQRSGCDLQLPAQHPRDRCVAVSLAISAPIGRYTLPETPLPAGAPKISEAGKAPGHSTGTPEQITPSRSNQRSHNPPCLVAVSAWKPSGPYTLYCLCCLSRRPAFSTRPPTARTSTLPLLELVLPAISPRSPSMIPASSPQISNGFHTTNGSYCRLIHRRPPCHALSRSTALATEDWVG